MTVHASCIHHVKACTRRTFDMSWQCYMPSSEKMKPKPDLCATEVTEVSQYCSNTSVILLLSGNSKGPIFFLLQARVNEHQLLLPGNVGYLECVAKLSRKWFIS
uniref:Uncharacterized protein n=1 Tax=Amphimedon queenslandica TaxID=400682 RepID=A0A1X7VGQ2_AMPQE